MKTNQIFGTDLPFTNLTYLFKLSSEKRRSRVCRMNAACPGFVFGCFDGVCCIQNGISAFQEDVSILLGEMLPRGRQGGVILLSSYSEKFCPHRLEWFKIQAEHGLIGEIDRERIHNGIMVYKDGFRATPLGEKEFAALTRHLENQVNVNEVDDSSIFCEIIA